MDETGERVGKPARLIAAELLDGLCRRWGSPPSVILAEDAHLVFQTLSLVAMDSEQGEETGRGRQAGLDPMERGLADASRPLSGGPGDDG